MKRLIAFLGLWLVTLPAWATCPRNPNDCTATPTHGTVAGPSGLISGPWTTSARPSGATTDTSGWNTTIPGPENRNGSAWVPIVSGGTSSSSPPPIGQASQSSAEFNVTCDVATVCQQQFIHGGRLRWQLQLRDDAERGNNAGSPLAIAAATDSGAFHGFLWEGSRASGGLGAGHPWFDKFSPYLLTTGRATIPNGIYGNDINGVTDLQPVATLPGTTPFLVTANSRNMFVFLPNCCGSNGPMNIARGEVWVKLHGAATVGGINVDTSGQGKFPGTPGPWYKVKSIINSGEFTVTLSAPAPGPTKSGGGAGSTAQPSFAATLEGYYTTARSGASGYPIQHASNYACTYDFYMSPENGVGSDCEQNYDEFYSTPETSGTYSYHSIQRETDIVNLNGDFGYTTNLFAARNPVTGTWFVPYSGNPIRLAQSGGTPHNVGQAITFGPGGIRLLNRRLGWYQATLVQANSIVGAGNDPTGHGGVAHDVFGSYAFLPADPFTTNTGNKIIKVKVATVGGGYAPLIGHVNGDTVTIPGSYNIAGVTFGGGTSYAIANVNIAAGTFTFDAGQFGGGGSNAAAAIRAGGKHRAAYFDKDAPYSAMSIHGELQHGLITTLNSRINDKLIVHTQPGNGVGWDDGTSTASVTGTEISAGHVSVDLTPTSGDPINAKGPLVLKDYTVGTLPTCDTALKFAMAAVTDATAPTYNGALTGGGNVIVPVFCNGTVWSSH